MTILTICLAFLAGIVSFASPCCLPLVPAYLSYVGVPRQVGGSGTLPTFGI
jgi:cytochrome c-type biogenesis protein